MFREVTLEELKALVKPYEYREYEALFQDAPKMLAYEDDGKLGAVMTVHETETDVRLGNMQLNYILEVELMSNFIVYAQENYAGKRLHLSAHEEEAFTYELLRVCGFEVDEVCHEIDDDGDPYEYIKCSKQL